MLGCMRDPTIVEKQSLQYHYLLKNYIDRRYFSWLRIMKIDKNQWNDDISSLRCRQV